MTGRIVFHPFLLALFPILFLYSCSLRMMPFHEILRSIFIAMCLVFLLWVIILKVVRNVMKSGLIVSVFLSIFFAYGYVLVIANPAPPSAPRRRC